MPNNDARLKKVLANVFGEKSENISEESSMDTIENWDSFNGLVLVDELENHFNVKFTISEITDVKSVADINIYIN